MLGIDGYTVLLCFCALTLSISISESSQGSAPISWYIRDTGDCVIFCSNALFIIHLMNKDVLFQLRCLSCLSLGASVLGNVLSAGRCFRTEQVHLSSCICQRRPSTGLLEDARLPLDIQTHGPWAPCV